MTTHENISQKLVDISGDLLNAVSGRQELQSRLAIIVTAWNMSLHSRADRQLKLKRFIRKQKGLAPSKEALKALEAEIKRIIKHKDNLCPEDLTELVRAEAIQQTKDNYEIKVFFKDKEEEAKQRQAQFSITQFNQAMSEQMS